MHTLCLFPRFLILPLVLVLLTSSLARASEHEFVTKAKYAILVDAKTGSVMYEKNADELMAPASMSKLMTLAVIFKALKDKELSLDDEFQVSENAWRTGGAPSGTSAMFAPLNTMVTLNDLLQGIVVQSGNDACIIVAEGMSGSEWDFADRMTRYARSIGLTKSTFKNSTGLHHPDHLMTARELAKLAHYLITQYSDFYHYFAQKEFKYRKHTFYNRNPLIFDNTGVDGLKTGYVAASGYGMVASALRGDQRLIMVVNGLESKKQRDEEARRILEWGFRGFKQWRLFDAGETVGEALVWGGTQRYVPLVGNGEVSVLLPRTVDRKVRAQIVYEGPLKPPIKKGEEVALLRITAANDAKTEVPLLAAKDIGRGPIWSRGFDSLLHLAFGWLL